MSNLKSKAAKADIGGNGGCFRNLKEVGEYIEGKLLDIVEKDGKYGPQKLAVLETKGGIVQLRVNKSMLDGLAKAKKGKLTGIMLREIIKLASTGKPFKLFSVVQ